jgi:hypothetical protein
MAAENMADIQVYEINGSRPESLSSQVAKKLLKKVDGIGSEITMGNSS